PLHPTPAPIRGCPKKPPRGFRRFPRRGFRRFPRRDCPKTLGNSFPKKPRPHGPAEARWRGRPLDLHFLGTPQAFVLSQDQTLHQINTDVNGPKRRLAPSGRVNPVARLPTGDFPGQRENRLQRPSLAVWKSFWQARPTPERQSPHKSSYLTVKVLIRFRA